MAITKAKRHYTKTAFWEKSRRNAPRPMRVVQVRLTEEMFVIADKMVRSGLYNSRSDFMRDAVRRMLIDDDKK